MLASASWDHTVAAVAARRRRAARARRPCAERQRRGVHAGRHARWSAPATTRPCASGRSPAARSPVVTLPTPLNAVAIAPDGEIVTAGADGKVYLLLAARRAARPRSKPRPTPIIALAVSPDGKLIAAAGIRGSVAIIDRTTRKLLRTLVGPGLPVWSAAFFPDNRTLLTGGTDRMIRRWDAVTGEPIGAVVMGAPEDPLAAYRGRPAAPRCSAPASPATRSRPTKATAPVRRSPAFSAAGSRRLPGYNFSEALKKLDIVWTPETVSKLFEVGPMAYTPGTKMPEQTHRLARGPRRAGAVSGEGDEVGATLVVALFGASLRAPTRGAPTYVPSTSSHRYVARTSSNTASATSLGVSCGRLCPATGITRC